MACAIGKNDVGLEGLIRIIWRGLFEHESEKNVIIHINTFVQCFAGPKAPPAACHISEAARA